MICFGMHDWEYRETASRWGRRCRNCGKVDTESKNYYFSDRTDIPADLPEKQPPAWYRPRG